MKAVSSWKPIVVMLVGELDNALSLNQGNYKNYFFYWLTELLFRPKHPIKVHVWAGISFRGATSICIFEGRMNAELFGDILEQTLLPFINDVYPTGHKLMQDNDPKHTSRYIGNFFQQNGVNWWKTPPESPDFNPIENMWHELKEYMRREIKPRTKDELMSGIEEFWNTVDRKKCQKYIRHLRKVLPRAIEVHMELN